jgi:hypothetical protein
MRDLRAIGDKYAFQRSSWYDYSWDWALAALFGVLLLAGVALLAGTMLFATHPQSAAILDDATTGQGTRGSSAHFR